MSELEYDKSYATWLNAAGLTPNSDPINLKGTVHQILQHLGNAQASSVTALDTSLTITPTTGAVTATAGTLDNILAAHTQGPLGTLVAQLNGATTRAASASAVAGEETVLTGTTASQTLTLPASTAAISSFNTIVNLSTQVWTVAAGAGTTVTRMGMSGSMNLVPDTYVQFVLIGTVWYEIAYSLAPAQVFTAGGTWTPSGTGNAIFNALVVGGGAGGGVGNSTQGGGGGGGGEVLNGFYLGNVTAGQTITIAAAASSAANGNTSSIGALAVAAGGKAGATGSIGGAAGDGQQPGQSSAQASGGGAGGAGNTTSTTGIHGGGGFNRFGAGGGGGGGPTSATGGVGGASTGGAGGTGAALGGGGGGGGGGGTGGNGSAGQGGVGGTAPANTGGGGGGGGAGTAGGAGGPGGTGYIVIYQVA